MNYKEIIKEGFTNPVSRKNIEDYFLRHYKIAEQNNYSINEFFDGCFEVINKFEEKFNDSYLKEKKNLIYSIKDNKDRLKNWKHNKISNIPPTTQEFIDGQENKLNTLNKETFTVTMHDKTHGRRSLKHGDIEEMKSTINNVKISLQSKKNKKPSNIEPLNFELNQSEVIFLFDILQEAGFLNKPKFHDGSYYRKLESYFLADKKPIKDAEQKRNKYLENPLSTTKSIKKRLIEAVNKMP